jgi:hypothetical protein
MLRPADQQLDGVANRRQVGCNVERVGQQQHEHQRQQNRAWQHFIQSTGEPFSRDQRQPTAGGLHSDDQRPREQHRPHAVQAELSAALRIGGDATRIIICGTGDQSGADATEHSR